MAQVLFAVDHQGELAVEEQQAQVIVRVVAGGQAVKPSFSSKSTLA